MAGPREDARILDGALVALNEEANVARSLASLLGQALPEGVRWGTVWVSTQGSTDRTTEIVREIARSDPRVRALSDGERQGKSAAVGEILRRCDGWAVAVLNADARAEPGALEALITRAGGLSSPFAVMARPVVPVEANGPLGRMLRLLWALHHELHSELLSGNEGNHLSDEMLLLGISGAPRLPEGTINDGSYLGAELQRAGGARRYAPDARVTIELPGTFVDYLVQRRRIRVGHAQVARTTGLRPTTLFWLFPRYPGRAVAVLRRGRRAAGVGWSPLAWLIAAELLSELLALWDRLPPATDHVRWRRVARPIRWGAERERVD